MKTLLPVIAMFGLVGTSFSADVTGDRLNIGTQNKVTGDWATIAGGYFNTNEAYAGVISGGANNRLESPSSADNGSLWNVIGGGYNNTIRSNSYRSTIAGGASNFIDEDANRSTIGGGDSNVISEDAYISWIGGGNQNFIGHGSSYASIGAGNRIEADDADATIGGGWVNIIEGSTVAGGINPSVIAGGWGNIMKTNGYANVIGGGFSNKIETLLGAAVIGGGYLNNIAGHASVIAGGFENKTEGQSASIGGGFGNQASGSYSTIPGGFQAKARSHAQLAYSSGQFSNAGDAQSSLYLLRAETTTTNQTELYLNGSGGGSRMIIPSGSTWVFEIFVAARSTGNQSAGYYARGVVENNGGATSLVDAVTITPLEEDVSAWDVSVQADDTADALVIKVNGAASTTIRWVATVKDHGSDELTNGIASAAISP